MLTPEERRKKARGANRKGKGFQRKVAKIFSMWFYGGNDSKLKSTPRSGGYRNKLVGDINNLDNPDEFPLHIECKNVEGGQSKWDLQDLLRPKSLIEQWWHQTIDDARISSKIPALVFTRSYEKIYIAITKYTYESVRTFFTHDVQTPRHGIFNIDALASCEHFLDALVVFELDSFLCWCSPQKLSTHYEESTFYG